MHSQAALRTGKRASEPVGGPNSMLLRANFARTVMAYDNQNVLQRNNRHRQRAKLGATAPILSGAMPGKGPRMSLAKQAANRFNQQVGQPEAQEKQAQAPLSATSQPQQSHLMSAQTSEGEGHPAAAKAWPLQPKKQTSSNG